MTDKLEEIKSRVWKDKGTYAMGDYSQREGYIYTLSDYDYEWLIEQAERVHELEQQNKRYREYLELIKTIGTYGKDISTGEIIRSDEANLAEEALESEE
ncbi:hypothetical protein [Caldifermentibacillus hisashii]|uniref:hypothetical protein n=1 Tax=Caldifermentibacillus hisashii TaxID=996558 RepID=UPI0031016AA2